MLRLLSLLALASGALSLADPLNTDGPLAPLRPDQVWTVAEVEAAVQAAGTPVCRVQNVDVFFVIDESGSVRRANWPAVTSFIQALVDQMALVGASKAQVGMILFDYYSHLQWDLEDFAGKPDGLRAAIKALGYTGGGTQIATAMNLATSRFKSRYGARTDVDRVMIVMTDGRDRTNVNAAREAAFRFGIKVIVIGVGPSVSQEELNDITGDPNLVFNVSAGYGDLNKVLASVCNATEDPCADVDCNGRGYCVPLSNGEHRCTCTEPTKWVGPDCETNKDDPCGADPCANGGSCSSDGAGGFVCACLPGFSGPRCSSGLCSDHGRFRCDCPPGYTGALCQTIIDFCNGTNVLHNGAEESLHVCSGHGLCSYNASIGSHCSCYPGWTGPRCDVIVDDCASGPCQNGGTCLNNDAAPGYYCVCPQDFTGKNCEAEPDFCHLSVPDPSTGAPTPLDLCGEHGTCSLGPDGGAACNCTAGFEGKRCEIRSKSSCVYTNTKGQTNTYPHAAVWVDDCNDCRCEYGRLRCAHSLWCPHKCAVYATEATAAANLTVGCQPKQNCVPDQPRCAANSFGGPKPGGNPGCAFPSGWCFPAGHVMVDDVTFPTNPPAGYREATDSW